MFDWYVKYKELPYSFVDFLPLEIAIPIHIVAKRCQQFTMMLGFKQIAVFKRDFMSVQKVNVLVQAFAKFVLNRSCAFFVLSTI